MERRRPQVSEAKGEEVSSWRPNKTDSWSLAEHRKKVANKIRQQGNHWDSSNNFLFRNFETALFQTKFISNSKVVQFLSCLKYLNLREKCHVKIIIGFARKWFKFKKKSEKWKIFWPTKKIYFLLSSVQWIGFR